MNAHTLFTTAIIELAFILKMDPAQTATTLEWALANSKEDRAELSDEQATYYDQRGVLQTKVFLPRGFLFNLYREVQPIKTKFEQWLGRLTRIGNEQTMKCDHTTYHCIYVGYGFEWYDHTNHVVYKKMLSEF